MQTTTSKKMTTMANNCYVQHHANIPPNRWNNDNNRQQINKWATNEIAPRYCSVGARYSLLATGSVQSAKALLHRLRCQRWRLQMIILAAAVPCRHATAQLAPHCNCLSLPTRKHARLYVCLCVAVLLSRHHKINVASWSRFAAFIMRRCCPRDGNSRFPHSRFAVSLALGLAAARANVMKKS